MKRLTQLAAVACLTLSVTLLSAQDSAESAKNTHSMQSTRSTEDPVAELTTKIMQQFFPDATLNEQLPNLPLAQRALARATASASAGNWPGPQAWSNFTTMPNLGLGPKGASKSMDASAEAIANIEQHLQQIQAKFSNLNQAKTALARVTARTAAPNSSAVPAAGNRAQAIAMSVSNGIFEIEATIESEDGIQKVRLNGTKAEVEAQINQLKPEIREALGSQLGL